jgi:hypothetical protein
MSRAKWSLDDDSKRVVAKLTNVRITFRFTESGSDWDTEEIEFWRSLPFVTFED